MDQREIISRAHTHTQAEGHSPERKKTAKMDPRQILNFLKFGVIYLVVAARLVGLSLYSVWLLNCFIGESHVRALCNNFHLFPNPEVIASIWLLSVSLTSICCLLYIGRLPQCPGFTTILKRMAHEKYFYKILVVLLLALIYDSLLISVKTELKNYLVSAILILEHITTVALMLTLNFVPKFLKNAGSRWNMVGLAYKITLAIYSLENYTLLVLETIAEAYNVIATLSCFQPSPENKNNSTSLVTSTPTSTTNIGQADCRDAKSTTMLLLHLMLIYIRHLTGEFFLTKIFQENDDILHVPLRPIDSSSTREMYDVHNFDVPGQVHNYTNDLDEVA